MKLNGILAATVLACGAGAACKARKPAGASVRAFEPIPAETIAFQPYDSVAMGARAKVDGTCLAAAASGRGWVKSDDAVELASMNFPPGMATVDGDEPAALPADRWDKAQDDAGTTFWTKSSQVRLRGVLDDFGVKGAHGISWVAQSALAQAFAAVDGQAMSGDWPRTQVVIGRKLISASRPSTSEALPPSVEASAASYRRCGDGAVDREYVVRDLVFVVLAREREVAGKGPAVDVTRQLLVKALSQGGIGEAEESILKGLIDDGTVSVLEINQEDDKPVTVDDEKPWLVAPAFKSDGRVGVRAAFYRAAPVAAYRALDGREDKAGSGGAIDVKAALAATLTLRFAAARATAETEKAAMKPAGDELAAALAACGGRRFNEACKALGGKAATALAAVPQTILAVLGGGAAPPVAAKVCKEGELRAGQALERGEFLCSPNKKVALMVRAFDDTIVVSDRTRFNQPDFDRGEIRWSSNTATPVPLGLRLVVGADGNAQFLANSGAVLWQTGTQGKGAAFLSVGDDGVARLKLEAGNRDQVIWSSEAWNRDTPGTLDGETLCGTTKGRVRRGLEPMEGRATTEAAKGGKDVAVKAADVPGSVAAMTGSASFSVNWSGESWELLSEPEIFKCLAHLAGDQAEDQLGLDDALVALSCARRPNAARTARCPDTDKPTRVAADSRTWTRLNLDPPDRLAFAKSFASRTYAEAEEYCTRRGERVPTADELAALLKDQAVLGADGQSLKVSIAGQLVLRSVGGQVGDTLLPTSTVAGEQRTYMRFSPDRKRSGLVLAAKDGVEGVMWACVANRTN